MSWSRSDSAMPATRRHRVRMASGGTMRFRRGRQRRSNIACSSWGGPGKSMATAPDSSIHWPGAVPRPFGRTAAPSTTKAWRLLISALFRFACVEARPRAGFLHPLAGGRAAAVRQDRGAFDDEGLALIDLRHFSIGLRGAPLQRLRDFAGEYQLPVERQGDGFAGQIVFGRAEAAGDNQNRRAR